MPRMRPIAEDPKTGERFMKVGGSWYPIKPGAVAANPNTGEQYLLAGDKWVSYEENTLGEKAAMLPRALASGVPQAVGETGRIIGTGLGALADFTEAYPKAGRALIQGALSTLGPGSISAARAATPERLRAASEGMGRFADTVSAGVEGIRGPEAESYLGQQAQGAFQSAGNIATGVLTGGALGGIRQLGLKGLGRVIAAPGAVVTAGQAVEEAKQEGKSNAFALGYGAVQGGIEYKLDQLPMFKFLEDFKAGRGFAGMFFSNLMREAPTEVATTLAQNAVSYAALHPEKPFSEFIAEQPAAIRDTLVQTAMLSGVMTGAGSVAQRLSQPKKQESPVTEEEPAAQGTEDFDPQEFQKEYLRLYNEEVARVQAEELAADPNTPRRKLSKTLTDDKVPELLERTKANLIAGAGEPDGAGVRTTEAAPVAAQPVGPGPELGVPTVEQPGPESVRTGAPPAATPDVAGGLGDISSPAGAPVTGATVQPTALDIETPARPARRIPMAQRKIEAAATVRGVLEPFGLEVKETAPAFRKAVNQLAQQGAKAASDPAAPQPDAMQIVGNLFPQVAAKAKTPARAPAPAPVQEAPAPAPVQEAPAPVQEAPAPVQEAPAPVQEAPAPAVAAEDVHVAVDYYDGGLRTKSSEKQPGWVLSGGESESRKADFDPKNPTTYATAHRYAHDGDDVTQFTVTTSAPDLRLGDRGNHISASVFVKNALVTDPQPIFALLEGYAKTLANEKRGPSDADSRIDAALKAAVLENTTPQPAGAPKAKQFSPFDKPSSTSTESPMDELRAAANGEAGQVVRARYESIIRAEPKTAAEPKKAATPKPEPEAAPEEALAQKKRVLARMKKAPGKTARQKLFAVLHEDAAKEAKAAKPEDVAENFEEDDGYDFEDPRFEEVIQGRAGLNRRTLMQKEIDNYKGSPDKMMRTILKELIQNSHDATRKAIQEGLIAQGKIDFDVSGGYNVTISDNGVGMSGQTLAGPFLELGTTGKTEGSGGFGTAKAVLLYASEKIDVITAHNGKVSTLDTTGQRLYDAGTTNDPEESNRLQPTIRVRDFTDADYDLFPSGHGTIVNIRVPEKDLNPANGEEVTVKEAPKYYSRFNRELEGIVFSPLFANTKVTYNGDTVEVGANFPFSTYKVFARVRAPFGVVDIYAAPVESWAAGASVLADGVYQFSTEVKNKNKNLPYHFYFNFINSVRPNNPLYPFSAQRKNFSPSGEETVKKLINLLVATYGVGSFSSDIKSFGNIQYYDPGTGLPGATIDLTPELPKDVLDKLSKSSIEEGSSIDIGEDGLVRVNGGVVDTQDIDALKAALPAISELKIAQDKINPSQVMLHDSADVVYKNEAGKEVQQPIVDFMRDKFGARLDDYFYRVGSKFLELRDNVVAIMDADAIKDGVPGEYGNLLTEAVGLSLDPRYRGVSTKVPFSGMFINPLLPESKNPLTRVFGMMYTMVHELAHYKVRSHDADFPAEMQRIWAELKAAARTGNGFNYDRWEADFVAGVENYQDIIDYGQYLFATEKDIEAYSKYDTPEYTNVRVVYRGERLRDASEEPASSGARGDISQRPEDSSLFEGSGDRSKPVLGGADGSGKGDGRRKKRASGARSRKAAPLPEELKAIAPPGMTLRQITVALQQANLRTLRAGKIGERIVESRDAANAPSNILDATVDLAKTTRSPKETMGAIKALWGRGKLNGNRTLLGIMPTDNVVEMGAEHDVDLKRIADIVTEGIDVFRMRQLKKLHKRLQQATKYFDRIGTAEREAFSDVAVMGRYYNVNATKAPTVDAYFKVDPELAALAQKGAGQKAIDRRKREIRMVYAGTDKTAGYNKISPEGRRVYKMMLEAYRETLLLHQELMNERLDASEMDAEDRKRADDYLSRLFEDALQNDAYMPLMRHDKFYIQIGVGKNAKLFTYASGSVRDIELKKMQKELAEKGEDPEIVIGDDIAELRNKFFDDKEASQLLKNIFDLTSDDTGQIADMATFKDAVFAMYLQSLPDNDLRKRYSSAQFKAGFSRDPLRDFLVSQSTAANQLARLAHGYKLRNTISAVEDTIKERPPQERLNAQALIDEMKERALIELQTPPAWQVFGIDLNNLARLGNQAVFLWYMTAPKSALIELTQLHIVGTSFLQAEYGAVKTGLMQGKYVANSVFLRLFAKAEYDEKGVLKDDWNAPTSIENSAYIQGLKKSNPERYAAMKFAYEYGDLHGAFHNTLVGDMIREGENPSHVSTVGKAIKAGQYASAGRRTMSKTFNFLGSSFAAMGRVSRETMFMSTFELEYDKQKKLGKAAPVARELAAVKALDLTNKALFNMSSFNKPRYLKPAILQPATALKSYVIMMTALLAANTKRAFKAGPEAKYARTVLFGTLGRTALYAGVIGGVPLYGMLCGAIDIGRAIVKSLMGDEEEDDPIDTSADLWIRTKFIPDTFGPDGAIANALGLPDGVAEFLAKSVEFGPISALLRVNLASSIGLNNLWFMPETRSPTAAGRLAEGFYNFVTGPLGGMAMSGVRGAELWNEGQVMRGVETVSPAFMREVLKSMRMGSEGAVSPDRYTITEKDQLSAYNLVAQALGFGTLDTFKAQSENVGVKDIGAGLEKKKTQLDRRWYIAKDRYERNPTDANEDKVIEAEDAIEKFANKWNLQLSWRDKNSNYEQWVEEREGAVRGLSESDTFPSSLTERRLEREAQ